AKYLAHHATWRSHARLVVRWRNISDLVLVRHGSGPRGSMDDFSENACARRDDSRRVVKDNDILRSILNRCRVEYHHIRDPTDHSPILSSIFCNEDIETLRIFVQKVLGICKRRVLAERQEAIEDVVFHLGVL